jgi:imidazolonepropionase-like amidohydrolase
MKNFVRCGTLFTGAEDEPQRGAVLVFDEAGTLAFVGPEEAAPSRAASDRLIDHSAGFVMPGLIDVHTHLAYGNAKCEEDIDLYAPLEFRTLRGRSPLPATPRSARPEMPGRSRFRSATQCAPGCSTVPG